MNSKLTNLINLHKEGKIDANASNKALCALQRTPAQIVKPDNQSPAEEILRKKSKQEKKMTGAEI